MNPIPTVDYIRILPELILTLFGVAVMIIDPLLKPGASRKGLGYLSLAGTLCAMGAAFYQASQLALDPHFGDPGWFGMIRADSFAIFFHVLIQPSRPSAFWLLSSTLRFRRSHRRILWADSVRHHRHDPDVIRH